DGRLDRMQAQWNPQPALGVVMASGGYPGKYAKGKRIDDLEAGGSESSVTKVFHAGTALDETGQVVTSGGRVLCACALGEDLPAARERAYQRIAGIRFDGAVYRRDIGHHALHRG